MEVRDGFIIGVYNYCDRWCERCPFTSHCHVFADAAALDASLDPNLKSVTDAAPLPSEAPPPPAWMEELLDDAQREPTPKKDWARMRPRIPREHRAIDARARGYMHRTSTWLERRQTGETQSPDEQVETIVWFHTMIAAKVNRALHVWPDHGADADVDATSDQDGSAKVALLGIDRSHVAWLEVVQHGVVSDGEAAPFIADLVWLGEALEQARPKARAFVRPAFDEPVAVAEFLVQMQRRS